MKLSRKILVALLAALMCFSLVFAVGCNIIIVNPDDSSSSSSDSGSASDSGSSSSSKEEKTTIMSVAQNVDYKLYSENKDVKSNKKNEFFDKTSTLKVGDDNDFVVMPNVQFGMLEEGDPIPTPIPAVEWTYEISFARITADGSVKVAADEVENYVEKIDYVNCVVNFAEGAIGSSFEISVVPTGLTDEQKKEIVDYTATMTVEVMDGFNVYDAKELSVINNYYGDYWLGDNSIWRSFKEENGIDVDYAPSNVLLQTNVKINDADLPKGFFFNKGDKDLEGSADYDRALGSLRDGACLYYRNVEKDESFCFDGNYFSLDCGAVSLVVRDQNDVTAEDKTFASHAALLYIHAEEGDLTEKTQSTVKNVNFIGNAPRVDDTTKTGGIILLKSDVIGTHVYNNISNKWFINYFPNIVKNGMLIEKCKGYDSFNSLIYVWGSTSVVIKDSEFIGAGGPVIIADHKEPENSDGGRPSDITIIDSNLHSYVAGTEGWFNMYGATAIVSTQVMPLEQIFNVNAYKRSFVTEENGIKKIDLIAVYKPGEMTGFENGFEGTKISGSLSFEKSGKKSEAMDFGTFAKPWDNWGTISNPVTNMYLETVGSQGAPVFVTSAGGISTITNPEEGLKKITESGIVALNPADANDAKMLQGDYLYMYFMKMGLCFGYGALAA